MRSILPFLLLLAGCGAEPDESDLSEQPLRTCTTSDCVQDGEHRFEQGTSSRDLVVWMPEDPRGAPVLFVWHHLGGSPEALLAWWPLHEAVNDGFVVVAPTSRGLFGTEWDVVSPGNSNEDVALFDDLLDSLLEVQGVDPDRIYATGFSAGGLFTTLLTMHRANKLGATAPFSGGAPPSSYRSPAKDIPVMMSWGGPSDTFGGFDFDGASRNAADSLVSDGHVVLSCDHGLGHVLPNDATDRTLDFFMSHAESGLVPDFESCARRMP